MGTKPIKSEREYCRVLNQIESLMDAKADTADGDRLAALATLAQAREEKHHAIEAPDALTPHRAAADTAPAP